MIQSNANNGIHCNECNYEGPGKTNSANAFIIFFVILCSSVFFLPLIIAALGFMVWVIATPAKISCPQCKSTNLSELTEERVQAIDEQAANKTPE